MSHGGPKRETAATTTHETGYQSRHPSVAENAGARCPWVDPS